MPNITMFQCGDRFLFSPSPDAKALGNEKPLPNPRDRTLLNNDLQALKLHHMQQLKRDSGRPFLADFPLLYG